MLNLNQMMANVAYANTEDTGTLGTFIKNNQIMVKCVLIILEVIKIVVINMSHMNLIHKQKQH